MTAKLDTSAPAQTDLTNLASDCSSLLAKHRAIIVEFHDLMMTQRMTREQAMNMNPIQWASECVLEWAVRELDQSKKVVAMELVESVPNGAPEAN